MPATVAVGPSVPVGTVPSSSTPGTVPPRTETLVTRSEIDPVVDASGSGLSQPASNAIALSASPAPNRRNLDANMVPSLRGCGFTYWSGADQGNVCTGPGRRPGGQVGPIPQVLLLLELARFESASCRRPLG